jgi:hypothetical protein
MKPQEILGLEITEQDAKAFGVKNAGRFVRDHLIRFLRGANLTSEYRVTWRTLSNGNAYVGVVYEPVLVKPKTDREVAS